MVEGLGHVGSFVPQAVAAASTHASSEQPKETPRVEVQTSAASAIYYSPAMKIDPEANMAIFVVRNSETGAVINQYPSKKVVDEYKRMDAKKTEEIRSFLKEAAPVAVEAKKEEIKAEPVKVTAAPVAPVPAPAPEAKPVAVEAKPAEAPKVKEDA